MKHGHPAGLGRAVEFEEAGVREHLHDGALGVRSRRRRRDHQLGDPVEVELRARRLGERQHHRVVCRHQRGERGDALAKNARAVLRIEALAAVDCRGRAAIGEGAEEVERVGVAHRHDEQRAVVAVHAEFDLRDERQHGAAAMIAYRALWVASRAGRVHQHPRIFGRHRNLRLAVACGGDQLPRRRRTRPGIDLFQTRFGARAAPKALVQRPPRLRQAGPGR